MGNKDCVILKEQEGGSFKVSLTGGTWDQWNTALEAAKNGA